MTRDRGSYGPVDRERHWIVGWGADQTFDYVRDQTVGAALRPAMPAVSDVFKAGRGASRVWTAARGIDAQAGKSTTQIGQELFHTVADRERAIVQLMTGFHALSSDLALWVTRNKNDPAASSVAHWIAADVTPTLAEWRTFVAREHKSWWTKMATSWETFEAWWERLKQLRSLARAHGATLQSAEPTPLPKTIWQHAEEGNGSEATAVLGVVKIGALAVLGLMGAAGLYTAIRGLREKGQVADEQQALRQVVREELRCRQVTGDRA